MPVNTSKKQSGIVGVMLAGGLSRRLGQDKARLILENNQNLLTRTVRLLLELVPTVLVVGREDPELSAIPEVECIPDRISGKGPLGGIATALEYSGSDCLVLSCDLPFMTADVLQKLISSWNVRDSGTCMLAYQQPNTEKIENLVAMYAYEALPFLKASLEKNILKVGKAIPSQFLRTITCSEKESLFFLNLNSPEDLALAQQHLLSNKD